jgi:phage recombination protein Bet
MNTLMIYENSGLNPAQTKLIKDTVCKGANDEEFKLFLHICVKTGLDPLMKQIYSIPLGGKRTIIVAIDGLRLIAERTNKYAPGREATFTYDKDGKLLSATAYIKKMTPDGTWHEISCTANFSEYNPGRNPIWTKMPHVMLAKCAEGAALRKAFPSNMSGLYIREEMDQAVKSGNVEDLINAEVDEIKEETDVEKDNMLSDFIRDGRYSDTLHFDIRCYMTEYCKKCKKSMREATNAYKDDKVFLAHLNKWKSREAEKLATMAA